MNTKNELFDKHFDLIQQYARVAWTKIMKPAKCTIGDLIQEGVCVFLNAKRDFDANRGATFRTFLIGCLRRHFTGLVIQSYQAKMSPLLQDTKFFENRASRHGRYTLSEPLEAVQMLFLIQSFNMEELDYIATILTCTHVPQRSRRKITRENLNLSFEREVKLRNSIKAKIQK